MAKATKPDLKAIVDGSISRPSPTAFDLWIEADPERAAEFWGHVDYARSRGCGWRLTVQIWNDSRDPVPLKFDGVRARHEARMKRGERPA